MSTDQKCFFGNKRVFSGHVQSGNSPKTNIERNTVGAVSFGEACHSNR